MIRAGIDNGQREASNHPVEAVNLGLSGFLGEVPTGDGTGHAALLPARGTLAQPSVRFVAVASRRPDEIPTSA